MMACPRPRGRMWRADASWRGCAPGLMFFHIAAGLLQLRLGRAQSVVYPCRPCPSNCSNGQSCDNGLGPCHTAFVSAAETPCSAPSYATVDARAGWASINYHPPGGYGADQDCRWTVVCPAVDSASTATISFTSFSTESSHDYVYVYEGAMQDVTPQRPRRRRRGETWFRHSGTASILPADMTMTTRTVTIAFASSDASANSGGFNATVDCSTQPQCVQCTAGQFNDVAGDFAQCRECAAGQYQGASGQPNCSACRMGMFANATSGASACLPCPPGRIQPNAGEVSCDECPVARQQSSSGETSCDECESGRFQDTSGQSGCVLCAPGTRADREPLDAA